MKKIMIFAALAALVSLASCQKEGITDNGTEQKASPVFTASIAGPTKTTIDMTDGKVSWEEYDEITVSDALGANAVYEIESIDATTGKATFVIKTGETPLGQGPYTATYGTEPEIEQTYSETAGKLYMTAPETSGNSFSFTVQCGLMEINLTKADESVKSIAVTGTPTGKSETTYTLTCTQAQNIATKKSFYIALPAGSYNKIVITDSEDKVCTLTAASGITVAANHIKPVTFEGSKLDFLPKGALPGVFSVGPNATDKIHFSQGNLTYNVTGTKWAFYEHQYDCAANGDASSTLSSLFTWGYSASTSLDPIGTRFVEAHTTDGDKLVYDKASSKGGDDWGVAYCESNNLKVGTWRTLSKEEWTYLTDTPNRMVKSKPCYSNVMDGGVTIESSTYYGVFLYPDNYSGKEVGDNTETWTWDKINSAGIVFLPAAGWRNHVDVNDADGIGYYWSSTAYVYCMVFDYEGVYHDYSDVSRDQGFSVRLITESK